MKPAILKRYLAILHARSLGELEATIVSTVQEELRKRGAERTLPVRLSRVAQRFQILPQVGELRLPGFGCSQAEQMGLSFHEALRAGAATGYEDGRIDYLEEVDSFLVRLRGLGDRARLCRVRFTYAHELAHRFFFAPIAGRWVRAVCLATETLQPQLSLQGKLHLVKLEERHCNAIARKLLMPDHALDAICKLEKWFARGEGMWAELFRAAGTFGVSPVTLLIRLRERSRGNADFAGTVLVVRSFAGVAGQAGAWLPRIVTALAPASARRETGHWYPGLEVAKLGPAFAQFIQMALSTGCSGGPLRLQLCSDGQRFAQLVGWWRKMAAESTSLPPALLLWGNLD